MFVKRNSSKSNSYHNHQRQNSGKRQKILRKESEPPLPPSNQRLGNRLRKTGGRTGGKPRSSTHTGYSPPHNPARPRRFTVQTPGPNLESAYRKQKFVLSAILGFWT